MLASRYAEHGAKCPRGARGLERSLGASLPGLERAPGQAVWRRPSCRPSGRLQLIMATTALHAEFSRPESSRDGTPLLVMLHGYGSNETTMAARFPSMPERFTCAAVRGPFDMDGDFGWFLLDYFLNNDFADVIAATTQLLTWVDVETSKHRYTSVSLLGHSQGMAMASTALRLRQGAFTAVVGLDGFVVNNPLLAATEPLATRTPFLWCRGTHDLVINPDAVAFTDQWLHQNTQLQSAVYPEKTHPVSPAELVDASSFLTVHVP